MAHFNDINIGDTIARSSKGGRTGQVIELDADRARIHWTKKANGEKMSQRNWINVREIMVVKPVDENRAVASIRKKMSYIISRVEEGPLVAEEREEMLAILGRIKGTDMWSIGIRKYMEGDRDHDDEFIEGLASQCMDDIFTMTCVVGQKAVIYLLRTIKPQ